MSLYTVAGYSKGPDGAVKFRVANSMDRAAVLVRNGHTQVNLVALPRAMDKTLAKVYVDGKNVGVNLGQLTECVKRAFRADAERRMSAKEAAQVRAKFNERVRIAYEAN
jgi:predicted GTPase